jgi:hypothetical protein
MKDPSSSLSVDPSSPDDPVENRFFQQGVDQEGIPKEEILDFEDQLRRQRRFLWIGGGATVLCALGLLLFIGRPEPPVPATEPVTAAAPAAPPPAPPVPRAAIPPAAVATAPAPSAPIVPLTAPPVTQPTVAVAPAPTAAAAPPAAAPLGSTHVAPVPAPRAAAPPAPAVAAPVAPVTHVAERSGVAAPAAGVAAPVPPPSPPAAVPPAVAAAHPSAASAPPASQVAPRLASAAPVTAARTTTRVASTAPARTATERALAREFARLEQSCRKAFGQRRYKDVRDSCARAFDAKPDAAELAALIAETEFDRGRALAGLSWARKAIAANPNLADAYVFIGSAEQQSRHVQAAKTAYLKYLELAPKGRYARDVRAVVRGL